MSEAAPPEAVLDLVSPVNCTYILSAKPAQPIYVALRRAVGSTLSGPKTAVGLRSADGRLFSVEVITGRESHTHSWTWDALTDRINALRQSWDRRVRERT